MTSPKPLLKVAGLVKNFDGVRALRGVSWTVDPGTIHGLVGENGAGKSTLIKIVSGVLVPDEGTVAVGGRQQRFASARDAQQSGIATLHQELALVPSLDAAENIFLGRALPKSRLGLVDWRRLRTEAGNALARLGVRLPLTLAVGRLSPAQQTMVTIARAMSQEARVLILDEPTASLTDREISELFSLLRQLRDDGIAVIYVSHRLEEIFALCDWVTVMRDGEVVTTQRVEQLEADELVRLMVGKKPDRLYPDRSGGPGEVVLRANNLTGTRVRGVSVELRRGEVVGIAGLGGSGRSELVRLLSGAQRADAGTVSLDGEQVVFRSPQQALQAGIALVPEERRTQGLVMTDSVGENLVAAVLGQLAVGGVFRKRGRERRNAEQSIESLRIKVASLNQNVGQLSGGNQQKVVLGKVLARGPKVLLLDEPTRGIDVGTKAEIYRLVRRLADDGTAVVVVSSELPELLGLTDRIVVLHEGTVVAELPAQGADEHDVLNRCYGRVA